MIIGLIAILGATIFSGICYRVWKRRIRDREKRTSPVRLMVVLGSGGHSGEMLKILQKMDFSKYSPRCYVVALGDESSCTKAEDLESGSKDHFIEKIYRSRKLHQSYISSIFSTLWATRQCISLVWKFRPDLVLCNGPGTCVPVCIVAALFSIIFPSREHCKIVFLESFCRVRSISLTGKILQYIADLFVVQWPELEGKDKKYVGRLF
ncbi:UDP-N-acetylglucosamine transferase subunit ALG14 homolog [Phlebotomus papatasi]|uniref:UDP-N-acetylglucosamine transferase subunit ALG14 homolog n=1 Tax=Phlebotomus papatasi TaxID=29031 RepID=UPI0024842ABC|nr:UDP-N-acetylglucosamine transferase subunit ALG14 homolog [Phlebotomus papatasi]